MSNYLKKQNTLAKKIRRKHPSMKWTSAVKQAAKELKGGKKIGSAKKKNRQTGTSVKSKDVQRKAKRPGKRKSRTGRTYIERRKNRSDVPGKLTGVSNSQLKSELKTRLEKRLGELMVRKMKATSASTYWNCDRQIKEIKAELNKL